MSLAALEPEPFRLLPYQGKALRSDKRLVFFGAGIGSGKTTAGAIWTFCKAREAPRGMVGLIAANSYSQLRDSTLRNAYRTWSELGIPVDPPELPNTVGPLTIRIQTACEGSLEIELLCRSLDNYEQIAGMEVGFAWLDEAWASSREAFDMVLGRLRDERGGFNRQMLITSTLDDPSHWLYNVFVEGYKPELHDVIYARTSQNPHLPADYEDQLRHSYSALLVRRMLEAEWISLAGGRIYHAFKRDQNVSEEAEFDSALPICWTHDFNIGQGKPMSSALCQIKRGPFGPCLDQFDELILESTDTNDAIAEFRERYPGLGARIYGDASGRAKDTRSKTTDYELLRAAGFVDQRVPKANPPIRDRHNAVNALLCNAAGQVRFRVHPRCRTTIKGWEVVKLRSGAAYLEEEVYEQHVTTAVGYLVSVEFPIVQRQAESTNLAIFRRR